jgi:hypothetical protein
MTTHTTDINHSEKSPTAMTTIRSIDMNLYYEALSRARTPEPRDEAHRSSDGARRVAMRARARQARELGDLSEQPSR